MSTSSKVVFAACGLLGLACLGSVPFLGGGARGGALLAGIVLVDLAQLRLRGALLPWMRLHWKPLAVLGLLGALLASGGLVAWRWAGKRQVVSVAGVSRGRLSVQETAGWPRSAELVVLDLPQRPDSPRVAVYDGLRPVRANIVSDKDRSRLVAEVSIKAHESKDLEVFLGASSPALELPDPEENWSATDAFQRLVQTLRFEPRPAGSLSGGLPFLGRSLLEIEIVPIDQTGPYVWIDLPVPGPAVLSESSELCYALRTERGAALDASVQIHTSAGYLYQGPSADQEGLSGHADSRLQELSAGRWYWRRIPLGRFAGTRLERVGVLVLHPGDRPPPAPLMVDLDAVRLAEGPALQARLVLDPVP